MPLYGLYIRDIAAGDLVWFTTQRALQAGTYTLGREQADPPDVYVAESIPALILLAGPRIDEVERRAKSTAGSPGTPADVEKRAAIEMADGLVERLTETSDIWEAEPPWLNRLRPVTATGGTST